MFHEMATLWNSKFSAFIVNWYFQQTWLIQDSYFKQVPSEKKFTLWIDI
jgi:hypothetical protein